jgi:hypothetical protein
VSILVIFLILQQDSIVNAMMGADLKPYIDRICNNEEDGSDA